MPVEYSTKPATSGVITTIHNNLDKALRDSKILSNQNDSNRQTAQYISVTKEDRKKSTNNTNGTEPHLTMQPNESTNEKGCGNLHEEAKVNNKNKKRD